MRIGLAVSEVRDAELELAAELGRAGERHRADHDVFHLSRTLIGIHRANLEALAPFGERYGAAPPAPAGVERDEPAAPDGGLLLLRDLRHLHLLYASASVNWVLLGQGAQVARDQELLDTVQSCHAQTLRGMKWTLTRLKAAAPQVLAS